MKAKKKFLNTVFLVDTLILVVVFLLVCIGESNNYYKHNREAQKVENSIDVQAIEK